MFRSKKMIITLVIVVLLGWAWHRHYSASKIPTQEAIVVDVEKVKQGNISMEAKAVGTLTAAKSVQLTPEVAGQVAKILAFDGSFVKQGTPIIQLDDAVNKAKAESDSANLKFSEANYHRMAILGKKGVISQQTIEQAAADLQGKKSAAKESITLANKMRITAPFDGVLGKVKVNLGEHVTVGQQLVNLTDTQNLRVEFVISEKYLSQLKIGQQVTLTTTTYLGKEFYGKVAFIAPTINTEDRTISLYADVPNQDGQLTAGLFVNVTQLMGNKNNVLLIPAESLVATIDGQQVFKIVNNKALAVAVKIGQRTIDQVEIKQGLAAGDVVVTAGQQKLRDGLAVKFKN